MLNKHHRIEKNKNNKKIKRIKIFFIPEQDLENVNKSQNNRDQYRILIIQHN